VAGVTRCVNSLQLWRGRHLILSIIELLYLFLEEVDHRVNVRKFVLGLPLADDALTLIHLPTQLIVRLQLRAFDLTNVLSVDRKCHLVKNRLFRAFKNALEDHTTQCLL